MSDINSANIVEFTFIPPEITQDQLLPQKSQEVYENIYSKFTDKRINKNGLLVYFTEI